VTQPFLSFEAFKAVDGIYEPKEWIRDSLAHSNEENRPWWKVDLGDVRCVWAVNILNRFTSKSDCQFDYDLYYCSSFVGYNSTKWGSSLCNSARIRYRFSN